MESKTWRVRPRLSALKSSGPSRHARSAASAAMSRAHPGIWRLAQLSSKFRALSALSGEGSSSVWRLRPLGPDRPRFGQKLVKNYPHHRWKKKEASDGARLSKLANAATRLVPPCLAQKLVELLASASTILTPCVIQEPCQSPHRFIELLAQDSSSVLLVPKHH